MQQATVYSKALCPYCSAAKRLLRKKGAVINEIAAGLNKKRRAEMIARSGGARTFPQIFIGDQHIGGCDELMALEAKGTLDELLAG